MLQDIAVLTGGQVITEDLGIKLEKHRTVAARQGQEDRGRQGQHDDHRRRRQEEGHQGPLRPDSRQIEKTTSDYDREKLQERLAKLTGGVAVIKAGAATETEMKERKDLLDDALHATKAAAEEGVVPGGGVILPACDPEVEKAKRKAKGDEKIGFDIVINALKAPTRQIVENGGGEGDVVVAELLEKSGNTGYNASTGEYVDMVKAGIIDPAKVAAPRCRTPRRWPA
jgi:chaperonin GroEL